MSGLFATEDGEVVVTLPVVEGSLDARGAGRLVVGALHDGARVGFAVRVGALVPGALGPPTPTMFVPERDEAGAILRLRKGTAEEMAAHPELVKLRWRINPDARPVAAGLTLESIGAPSDRFVAALAHAYVGASPARGASMPAAIAFVALCQTAIEPGERLAIKLFAETERGAAVELFLNVDAERRTVELVEKDAEYREPLLRLLGARSALETTPPARPASPIAARGGARTKQTGSDELLSLDGFSYGARQAIFLAQGDADARHHEHTTVLHVLHQLLSLEPLQRACREAGADPDAALAVVAAELLVLKRSEASSCVGRDLLAVCKRAEVRATSQEVGLLDVLRAAVASGASQLTIADLDEGLGSGEHAGVVRAVAKGHLERILPTP